MKSIIDLGREVSVVKTPSAVLDLGNLFFFEGRIAVERFISERPQIAAILPELRERIDMVFGISSQIMLEVLPDFEDGTVSLNSRILCDMDIDDALGKLDDLNRQWWYEKSSRFVGSLTVDVEMI